jgi:sugar lactone lactonase YvrE
MKLIRLAAVLPALVLAVPALPAAGHARGAPYQAVTTITGPGVPPGGQWCVDISYYDKALRRYYLSDASNRRIDVVDARTNRLLPPIGAGDFTGPAGCLSFDFSQEGPQGIVTDSLGQLWAGNGDSRLHVYDTRTGRPVAVVNTGGTRRADELAYDRRDKLIIVTNPDEALGGGAPFVTLISAVTHRVVTRFEVPGAQALEQPAWNPRDGKFYMSVPATSSLPGGEVAVISPEAGKVTATYPAGDCGPGGLAIDVQAQVMALGCATTAALMNISDGTMSRIPQIIGVDEVWFSRHRFYFGSYAGPSLGVVTANGRFVVNIPVSGAGFHAAASGHGEVFIPESGLGIVVLRDR